MKYRWGFLDFLAVFEKYEESERELISDQLQY